MPKEPQSARRLVHNNSAAAAGTGNVPSRVDQSQNSDGNGTAGGTSAATAMDVQTVMPRATANVGTTADEMMTRGAAEGASTGAGVVSPMDASGGGAGLPAGPDEDMATHGPTTGGEEEGNAEHKKKKKKKKQKKKNRKSVGDRRRGKAVARDKRDGSAANSPRA